MPASWLFCCERAFVKGNDDEKMNDNKIATGIGDSTRHCRVMLRDFWFATSPLIRRFSQSRRLMQ
jgi:hypothetical protein